MIRPPFSCRFYGEPPLELLLRILLLERDVHGLLNDLGYMLQGILHTKDFSQTLELRLEVPVGGEAKIERIGLGRLEHIWRGVRPMLARRFLYGRSGAWLMERLPLLLFVLRT
jgi:hypothetical protein